MKLFRFQHDYKYGILHIAVSKPFYIPPDVTGQAFPFSQFMKRPNGESENRDWLVYSQCKNALGFFPCRLFAYTESCNWSTPCPLHI